MTFLTRHPSDSQFEIRAHYQFTTTL